MASHPRLPPKKDVALALLEQSSVFVHLDPRSEAVRVPPWFKKQPQLVLQIGLNMPVPIPDLDVGEDGIFCTLSFNRSPHSCWIPWASVFALVGDNARGMVWPDDVPSEVTAQAAQQQARAEEKPSLRAVPSKPEPSSPKPEAKQEKPKKKRARKPAKDDAKKAARAEPRATAARPAPVEAKATPQPRTASTGTSSASADKPRRPLPPYLRVIK